MLKLGIKINPREVLTNLNEIQEKQLPFAVSKSLNQLANIVQKDIRSNMEQHFQFKSGRKSWVLQGVYISKEDRASKTNWSVKIQIQDARTFLEKFELGGEVFPVNGKNMIAIPNSQVFGKKVIPATDPLRLHNLALHTVGNRMEGLQNTFTIKGKDGSIIVLQNITKGTKKKDSKGVSGYNNNRTIWTLVKRVKAPAKLEFIKTADETVRSNMVNVLEQNLADAVKTAKK